MGRKSPPYSFEYRFSSRIALILTEGSPYTLANYSRVAAQFHQGLDRALRLVARRIHVPQAHSRFARLRNERLLLPVRQTAAHWDTRCVPILRDTEPPSAPSVSGKLPTLAAWRRTSSAGPPATRRASQRAKSAADAMCWHRTSSDLRDKIAGGPRQVAPYDHLITQDYGGGGTKLLHGSQAIVGGIVGRQWTMEADNEFRSITKTLHINGCGNGAKSRQGQGPIALDGQSFQCPGAGGPQKACR